MRLAAPWRDKFYYLLRLVKSHRSCTQNQIYSEFVYCNLVRTEWKRSVRSGLLCRIVLFYWTDAQGQIVPLEPECVGNAIAKLSMSVRATDYIGWYRQGRVVGVLLTTIRPGALGDEGDRVRARLADRLHDSLIPTDGYSLYTRVFEPDELGELTSAATLPRRWFEG